MLLEQHPAFFMPASGQIGRLTGQIAAIHVLT
jgi:hypothetical protein